MGVGIRDGGALLAASPSALSAYARSAGWHPQEPHRVHLDIYVGDDRPQIIVPGTEHLGDYAGVVATLVGRFARVAGQDELTVYGAPLTADRDVVRVGAGGSGGGVRLKAGVGPARPRALSSGRSSSVQSGAGRTLVGTRRTASVSRGLREATIDRATVYTRVVTIRSAAGVRDVMSQPEQSDEQSISNQVHKIIDDLIAFDEDSRVRIYRTVGTFFGFDSGGPRRPGGVDVAATRSGASREPYFSSLSEPPPKEFLFEKRPSTDVDRVACLAYYLTHYRGNAHFKATDVSKLNTEAAQIKFSNPSAALNNAIRSGLLAATTGGRRRLTEHGKKYVEALPDRRAARQLRSQVRS